LAANLYAANDAAAFVGAVPFLYSRVGNKSGARKAPPPVFDLAAADHDVWNKIFWAALQNLFARILTDAVKAATRSYRQKRKGLPQSHIIRALSVLSLYQAVADRDGVPPFWNLSWLRFKAD